MAKKKHKQPERASTVKRIDRTEYESLIPSMTPDQSEAAARFSELYYGSQGSGGGYDYSRVIVDGGNHGFEISDHVIDCHTKLVKAAEGIGKFQFNIIHMYIARGFTAEQVAKEIYVPWNTRAARGVNFTFKVALTQLALFWGITARKDHSHSSYFWNDGDKSEIGA